MSSIQNKQIRDKTTRPLQSQNGNAESHGSSKNQLTSEQLRIAQISSDKSDVDPEMAKKIKEVSDLTGRSQDEAWTALHDCNGDTNQAVDLLFEKQDDSQVEWQEKKKKKKAATTAGRAPMSDTMAFDTRQERTEIEAERTESIPKGQQGRAPRFQRGRGRGNFSHNANGERDTSVNCDQGSSERRFDGGRGRRGGRGGGGAGRGRGGRGTNSTGFETVPHIDTWTNDTVQNGKSDTSFGAWQETNEEWTADEWSGSLEESLVLTRSMATRPDVFAGMTDSGSSQHQAPQSQGYVSSNSRAPVGSGMADGTTEAGYRQQAMSQNVSEQASRSVGNFDINHLLPKFSEPYVMSRAEESAYLSHFNKEATECIKNAVGIGSSSLGSHGTGAGSAEQMGRQVPQSASTQQVQLSSRMKNQQQQQQQQRSRLPLPSKIPASAVEMPGSVGNAHLDVQFGYLDMPSSSQIEVSSFLNDVPQSSQFTGPALNVQQPGTVNLTDNAKIAGMDPGIYQPGVPHSMNDSTSSTVLAMQEIAIGPKSAAYQQNTVQQKELGTSSKILPFPSSNEERKPMSSFSSQPSNQMPGQGSLSSHLGLSQLAYSSNIATASSAYKASSAASGASAFSQPAVTQHGLPGTGSLQHPLAGGAQAMRTPHYPGNPAAHANYPYTVTEQANFGGTPPSSYGAASTQAFGGSSKPFGATDKPAIPSGLSQVYETPGMGNTYPTGNQMTYQSGAVMYLSNQQTPGLSCDGAPSASGGGGGGSYQNPASLYRTVNASDFSSGIGESFPRGAVQQSTPGKLTDGLNKLAVRDSTGMVPSQQYDSAAVTISSLTSASVNPLNSTSGLAMTSAASASLRASSVATTKSTTVAGKTAVNWPSGLPPPMMNLNPNYVIGQPPGFQLAAFGYPAAQQTVPYSYEDIQILQHRYALQPTAYYDMQIPAATTLPTRDLQSSLTTASYVAGSDVKLTTPVEPPVSVAIQPTHQPAAAAAALHGYSYYYPGAPGIVPMQSYYTPMIPMSGMAVPMVTNPSHGATTTSAQYQKPTMYGSHSFGPGGLSQDFAKTFNQQASVKAPGTTAGVVQNEVVGPGNAFGKSHVQGFDKAGFHSGTPPPTSFGLALASGSQEAALGQPAVYGAPYMPMMPHQSHSQVHHTVSAQDSSIVGRGVPQQNAVQGKIGPNKNSYSAPYWAPGN